MHVVYVGGPRDEGNGKPEQVIPISWTVWRKMWEETHERIEGKKTRVKLPENHAVCIPFINAKGFPCYGRKENFRGKDGGKLS
jgi:hypothetical protein